MSPKNKRQNWERKREKIKSPAKFAADQMTISVEEKTDTKKKTTTTMKHNSDLPKQNTNNNEDDGVCVCLPIVYRSRETLAELALRQVSPRWQAR